MTGWAGRGLATTAAVLCLAGCTSSAAEPAATATVTYCVGEDSEHPAGSQATVRFNRGDTILGEVSNVVAGGSGVTVSPGEVAVYVDDVLVTTMTVTAGAAAYASQGKNCSG